MKKHLTTGHILLLTILLYGLAYALMLSGTFLGSDTGLRFLQVRELISQNWQTLAIRYPGQFLDPHLRYVPFYYAYAVINDQIYLSISPFLPLLASWFYARGGIFGLPIVPVMGGVVTAVGVYILSKQQQVRYPHLAMWAAMFATPLVFYAVVLWDHTLMTACVVWSVVGITYARQSKLWWPAFLGGVAAGLGAGQRPEMYAFIIALGISTLLVYWGHWRLMLSFGAGLLVSILVLWWGQFQWYSHPLGMPTANILLGYGKPPANFLLSVTANGDPIPRYLTISKFLGLLEARNIPGFGLFLVIVAAIYSINIGLRREQKRLLQIGLVLGLLGYGLCIVKGMQGFIVGILPTFPLLALSITPDPLSKDKWNVMDVRFVMSVSLIFLVLMLIFWPADGGLQWGARYLLLVYPLFVFLAFNNYARFRQRQSFHLHGLLQVTAGTLLLLSFVIQGTGLWQLYNQLERQIPMKTLLDELPVGVIITNRPFLPSEMAAITDKIFLYVGEEAAFAELLPELWNQGIKEFAYVPSEYATELKLPTTLGDFQIWQKDEYLFELAAP